MDYVYIHMEAPDECGHQHQVREKGYSIEQIDEKVLTPVYQYLEQTGEDYALLVMPDHPTPLTLMTHVGTPIPYILYHKGDHNGRNCRYTEAEGKAQNLFIEDGSTLISRMMHKNS